MQEVGSNKGSFFKLNVKASECIWVSPPQYCGY